jgi:hypothetical protein
MTVSRSGAWIPASSTVLLLLAACTGCDGGRPTTPGINAGSSSGGDPTVTSTTPDSATQDTTLDVTIAGSGFDAGSQAQWAQSGVPSLKVRTNSTRFVSSRKLIANITIAVDADPGLYDVLVTTAEGKKGIGTELFTVKLKLTPLPPGPSLDVGFSDQTADNVRSDGRGTYRDGLCGVTARLNFDDAILNPSARPIGGQQKRQCGTTAPRYVALEFDDPLDGVATDFPITGQSNHLSVDKIGTVTVDAGAVERQAQLNGTCNRLVFNPDEFPGTSRVLVTRIGPNTWSVVAPIGAVAWCVGRGKAYRMPFAVTVTQLN